MFKHEELPRVRGEGLQGEIYQLLRQAILTGTLAPGERLLELHLARQFGTSQTPVREALRRLVEERLVEYRPRRGTYVRKPRLGELEDVYSLRAELEAWAARRLIARKDANDHYRLRQALQRLEQAAAKRDIQGVVDADMEIHRTLCECCGSPLLLEIWTAVDSRVRGLRSHSPTPTRTEFRQLVDQHRGIVEALISGDIRLANRRIREHMRTAPQDIPHE